MNPRILTGLLLAALALLLRPAVAQDEAPATKPTEPEQIPPALVERYRQMAQQLTQPPGERDLKIVEVAAQKTPLFRADPKLFENKFSARMVFRPGGVDLEKPEQTQAHLQRMQMDSKFLQTYPSELQKLQYTTHSRILPFSVGFNPGLVGGRGGLVPNNPSEPAHFQGLANQCRDEFEPEKRLVEFLTSAESTRDVRWRLDEFPIRHPEGTSLHQQLAYTVFAPTAAEAEARARAIVRLYDEGLSRPMRQHFFGEGQKHLDAARGIHQELAKVLDELRVESEKLAKPSEISGDILSQLKAQKVMVAVELAGLSARVKACDAMLADPKKLEISTLQSISDMKVKAEIERVGIKEKLDQINVFIAEGDARQAASMNRLKLDSRKDRLRQEIRTLEQMATQYAELFDLYAPFQIPDNQITVGPIEWTQE